jgi:serine/threonine-protein kinase
MTSPVRAPVSAASLGALAALGFASALWAGFLWSELLVARAGGTPFCGLAEGGCTALWDGAFAREVHRLSGVPVAGFGLLWGLVAALVPLLALVRAAEGREAPEILSAVRIIAGAGLVAVFVLVAVLAVEGAFCSGCFLSYLLAAGYAGIALGGWQRLGLPAAGRGGGLAAGAAITAYLGLLYPGTHTPRGQEGRKSIEAAAPATAPGTGHSSRDEALQRLVSSLPPQALQTLSDSLYIYATASQAALPAPRSLLGPADAPVRITEFTDVLCDHCAELGEVLEAIRERVPEGSFSVEPRHFPLDGRCNPRMQRPYEGEDVRCLAARVGICLEGGAGAEAVPAALFAARKELTPRKVLEIAKGHAKASSLEACLASPETERKLQEDIALAARFDIHGTPLVLVNGRKGTSFGPFLYAMILTGGAATHPAFASLPPANPDAHVH